MKYSYILSLLLSLTFFYSCQSYNVSGRREYLVEDTLYIYVRADVYSETDEMDQGALEEYMLKKAENRADMMIKAIGEDKKKKLRIEKIILKKVYEDSSNVHAYYLVSVVLDEGEPFEVE